ncbi:MAG: recombinase family protein [Pseudomonadales bacterium]
MKRVAIYCRRSKDDGDQTISLPEQEAECRRFASTLGVVNRVVRENHSGVTGFDRPMFEQLIQAGERKDYDILVTLDVSRFGRFTPEERGYWLTRLHRAGVEVRHAHDDSRLTGEAGSIMGTVLQQAAREQSIMTARRVAMGQVSAAERGFWPGGAVPYGFRLERSPEWKGTGRRNARLVAIEEEAALVRWMFERRAEGVGLDTIARQLNEDGKRTRRGRLWTGLSVRSVLINSACIGVVVRGRNPKGQKKAKFFRGSPSGPVSKDKPSPGYEAHCGPAIVSRELWDKVQQIGAEQSAKFHGKRIGNYGKNPLAGLCRCGSCDGSAAVAEGTTRQAKQVRYAYYVCSQRARGAEHLDTCSLVRAPAERLAEAVVEKVRLIASQIDPAAVAAGVRRRLSASAGPDVDIKALEAKRRRLGERRRQLVLAESEFEREALADLAAEDARLAREIEAAKARVTVTDAEIQARVAAAVKAATQMTVPDTVSGRQALNRLLRTFVHEVRILPSELRKQKAVDLTVYTPEGLGDRLFGPPAGDEEPVLSQAGSSTCGPTPWRPVSSPAPRTGPALGRAPRTWARSSSRSNARASSSAARTRSQTRTPTRTSPRAPAPGPAAGRVSRSSSPRGSSSRSPCPRSCAKSWGRRRPTGSRASCSSGGSRRSPASGPSAACSACWAPAR